MRAFRVLLLLGGVCLMTSLSFAQGVEAPPEVDAAEVRRRGDYVEHVLPGIQSNDEWGQVASLPESDIDKFQLIVVGMKGCEPCKKLSEAWKTDTTLRTWARPDDKAKSWAAFHYVRYDDPLQQWRFKGEGAPKIKLVPTIILQAPRSGKYGQPSDVIHVYVYTGDPKAWEQSMLKALKAYHAALRQDSVPEPDPDDGFQVVDENAPFSQQSIPPLDLPLPDEAKPDDGRQVLPLLPPGPGPRHDTFGARRESIVIVTDERQLYGETIQAQIDATVKEVQGGDPTIPIYQVDLADAKKYGVEAEELPVVLKVDGRNRVVEKRLPKVEKDVAGWGPIISMLSGLGYLIYIFFWCVGAFVMVVFWTLVILFVIWLLRKIGIIPPKGGWPAQTPAPAHSAAPQPVAAQSTHDYEAMIAERKRQLEYEELTAKVQAAKAANATIAPKPAAVATA